MSEPEKLENVTMQTEKDTAQETPIMEFETPMPAQYTVDAPLQSDVSASKLQQPGVPYPGIAAPTGAVPGPVQNIPVLQCVNLEMRQDIGDFAGGIVAMSCSEDTIVLIPFQRILTKIRCWCDPCIRHGADCWWCWRFF